MEMADIPHHNNVKAKSDLALGNIQALTQFISNKLAVKQSKYEDLLA